MKFEAWPVEPPGFGSGPGRAGRCRSSRGGRGADERVPTMPATMTTTRALLGSRLWLDNQMPLRRWSRRGALDEDRLHDLPQRRLRAVGVDRPHQEFGGQLGHPSMSQTVEVSGGASSREIGCSPNPATATSPGIDRPSSAHAPYTPYAIESTRQDRGRAVVAAQQLERQRARAVARVRAGDHRQSIPSAAAEVATARSACRSGDVSTAHESTVMRRWPSALGARDSARRRARCRDDLPAAATPAARRRW